MHILVDGEDAYAGMSRFLDVTDPVPWTLPERETFLILEGAARIEIVWGPTLKLRVARRPNRVTPQAPPHRSEATAAHPPLQDGLVSGS